MATVIFKPTEACNARCIYCDVVQKKPRAPVTMPLETLELFFSRINEFLREKPGEEMEVIWHGGEPLLLGPDYFYQAFHFQEKHCAQTGSRIRHSIQSNLTLFSREFTDVMKKLGITSFGTSYDPIENLRGLGRKRDSQAYNRRFMEGIRLVEEEGFGWGIIYVVTKLSLAKPLEIFRFLSNFSPSGAFMFNPVLLYGRELEHLKVTPEEYADFLGAIFPVWWRHRNEFPQVEPFSSLVGNLLEDSRSLMCCDSGACAHHHINLLADGSMSQCGRSADWGLLDYGSIFDKSFSEVLADPQRDVLLERNTILPETKCKGCRFWDICHGGCPLDAWSASRSFLHKSEWCYAKKGFIEKYFEPLVNPCAIAGEGWMAKEDSPPPSAQPRKKGRTRKSKPAPEKEESGDLPWINPIGGLGDTLMISGVLKQVVEKDPTRRFNLVARTKYRPMLEGHPAIAHIGHPPPGAGFISTNYWDHMDYRSPGRRAFQILARIFGLKPVEERLYVPWELEDDPAFLELFPWKSRNVLICQSSDSPRKQMGIEKWEALVEMLAGDQVGVFQAGKMQDRYIRGAYSLLGLTTPRQLINLVRHFDAVVTSDNFIMHAAHLCGTPAVVLWGPTDHRVYGYSGQIHLQSQADCEYPGGCLGPENGHLYQIICPQGPAHCLNTLPLATIYRAVMGLLEKP
ncbi:MAG: radical SAM protein [Deltaproteobacteria bacterium]|nr:radical SAM protein [Deltaproteobacteria bacterium]